MPFDIGKHIGKRQKQPRLFVIFLFVRGHHQIDMLQLYRVRVYIDFPFADRRFQTKPNAVKGMRIPRRSAQRNQILHGFVFARAAVNRNGHGHIVFCRGLTMATGCIACKNGVCKVPVVMQMEALECGAASLAMILAYYEKWIPLEQVRADCGVSRDGSNARNILRAARSYGLTAKGYRYEPKDLNTMDLKSLRRKIGVVMQNGKLFQGDIFSNIVISAP